MGLIFLVDMRPFIVKYIVGFFYSFAPSKRI